MYIRKTILLALMGLTIAGGWIVRSIAQGTLPSPSVTFLSHERVDATFAHPGVGDLFAGKSGEANFKVIAASRDRPGEAEVHNLDADVIYVVSGTATLVTGGTAVEAKTTAPDEIRGKSIEGGEPRRLSRGDVLIIPHGVPHWFKEVEGQFHYFVVKVH